MSDILLAVSLALIGFVAIDHDRSVWREREAVRERWGAALAACANGHGFTVGRTLVFCDAVEVIPPLVAKQSSLWP